MSEQDIISNTLSLNTIDTMCRDLARLGVSEGETLLVHSSLSSLGWVCGGPQAVVSALRKTVGGQGTLVMPAHSGDWSDPAEWEKPPVPKEWIQVIYDNMPAYEPEITPTRGMGSIAELFRTYPGTMRSGHPQVSFCANGKLAGQITEGHPLTPQMGMASPLGKLYAFKARILLLGVGYENCTSFHLAETLWAKMPVKRMGTAILEDGERIWKSFEDFEYNSEDFDQLGTAFEESPAGGCISKGKVGNAECRLFDMQTGVDFAKEWLAQNRKD